MNINSFGPFNVEVYATVSDWIMVLATIVTAIYLIRTFKAQEEIKRIELIRYVNSIRPHLVLK